MYKYVTLGQLESLTQYKSLSTELNQSILYNHRVAKDHLFDCDKVRRQKCQSVYCPAATLVTHSSLLVWKDNK